MFLILKFFLKEDISGVKRADPPLGHIPRVSCRPQEELFGHLPIFVSSSSYLLSGKQWWALALGKCVLSGWMDELMVSCI